MVGRHVLDDHALMLRRTPPHPALRQLGARLKAVRSQAGWTQEQLAEAVRLTTHSVSQYETGKMSLRVVSLVQIAEALQVGLGDLLDLQRSLPAASPPPEGDELLRHFRSLDRLDRELATRLLRDLAEVGARRRTGCA